MFWPDFMLRLIAILSLRALKDPVKNKVNDLIFKAQTHDKNIRFNNYNNNDFLCTNIHEDQYPVLSFSKS